MINLVIDGNNIIFRSMFVCGNYGEKGYTFDKQYELDQLMRKVCIDISYIVRHVNPSRVIVSFDSKSWRKDISIDENDGYKANREKSKFLNWDKIYGLMKELGDILDGNGFIVSKIDKAEADDLIGLWVNELLVNQKQHVIVASSDEDIRQLVQCNNNLFSLVLNPYSSGKIKKLFVPKGFEEWLSVDEEGDIFNRFIDVDKEDFRRIDESSTTELIDGNKIALRKIFCGDDGDNVPAIFTWINDKDKTIRITNSKFEKIVESIGAKGYKDLIEKADPIYDQIVNISGKRPPFKMKDRLERQIKLVVLSREIFPKEIVEKFDNSIQEQLKKPNISPQSFNVNSILEGTKYIENKNEASIFKDIDDLTKFI